MSEKENSINTSNGPIQKSSERSYTDTEIVIGLVGAVGTQQKRVVEAIADRLKAFNYSAREIHVSQDVIGTLYPDIPAHFTSEFDRISTYINCGNRARESSGDNSILALGVCSEIFRERMRDESHDVRPRRRIAYLVLHYSSSKG